MTSVYSDAIAVMKLSKAIVDGSLRIHQIAQDTKDACDELGLTLKDDSYQKVYSSLEVATIGFESVKNDIMSVSEAMEAFAKDIVAGKAVITS